MFISMPDAVMHAIQQLNGAGYEAYIVGGCVRDYLLNKTPTDWDITTSASPSEMQVVFASYRTIETGIKHGTLTVIIENTPIEITTYRIDGDYSDGRHPDSVTFTRSLSNDLQRRDFTINAMAYHPITGIVDLYNGQADLQARIIRCVGNAEQRFSEDALRILRALRFASVLGFSVEENTDLAARRLCDTLYRVSTERIWHEFTKLLCGKEALRIATTYTDILSKIAPEMFGMCDGHLLKKVPNTLHVRLSALFYESNISPDASEVILRRLHADTHTITRVKSLLSCRHLPMNRDAELLHLLNRLDKELIFDHLSLCEAKESTFEHVRKLLDDGVCYKIPMLAVDGNDLIRAGIPAGPAVGQSLQELLDCVISGHCINSREALLNHLQK